MTVRGGHLCWRGGGSPTHRDRRPYCPGGGGGGSHALSALLVTAHEQERGDVACSVVTTELELLLGLPPAPALAAGHFAQGIYNLAAAHSH